MKKIIKLYIMFIISFFGIISCDNDGYNPAIENSVEVPLPGFEKVASSSQFIDATNVNGTNIMYELDLQAGEELASNLDVYIEWTGDADFAPALLESGISPSQLPFSGNVTGSDLAQLFPSIGTQGVQVGQSFIIFAVTHATNGKSYPTYTALGPGMSPNDLSSSLITMMPYLTYDVSCSSNLGGTYNYSTTNFFVPGGTVITSPETGTVNLTEIAAGEYSISDASFGCWPYFYGETADGLNFKDVCNKISFTGSSQYGDTFTISNIVVNGSNFSFHWETSYGEYGDTTLTRTDGTNWPNLY